MRLQTTKQTQAIYSRYGSWKPEVASALLADTYLALCEAANTPTSLGCWLRFKHGEVADLIQMTLNPMLYDDADVFGGDYLCVSFLSKFSDFDVGIDKEAVAFGKWLKAESLCRETNHLLRLRDLGEFQFSSRVEQVLHFASLKIADILGDVPLSLCSEQGRFGPGADLSTRHGKVSSYYKYSNPGSSTPGILELVSNLGEEFDNRAFDVIQDTSLVRGSRLTFVPKNAKTHRSICIEPRWNIYFQLGIGEYIADRLRISGVDVTNQQCNRDFAKHAWRLDLATVDLSSASDTISKNLVLGLLPVDWCDLLFQTRSPVTTYRGQTYELEKISSMGNGYTFPLETLIFYGVLYGCIKATGGHPFFINAYGDDLICPRYLLPLLKEVFLAIGFSVNSEKTFDSGVFFESCGNDYFRGWNVRPIFLKESVNNVERAFRLANQITEFARRRHGYGSADARYMVAQRTVVRFVPKSLRFFGPINASAAPKVTNSYSSHWRTVPEGQALQGASFIHAPLDQVLYSARPYKRKYGYEGFVLKALLSVPVRFDAYGPGLLFHKLSGASFVGNFVPRRDRNLMIVKEVIVDKLDDFAIV